MDQSSSTTMGETDKVTQNLCLLYSVQYRIVTWQTAHNNVQCGVCDLSIDDIDIDIDIDRN